MTLTVTNTLGRTDPAVVLFLATFAVRYAAVCGYRLGQYARGLR